MIIFLSYYLYFLSFILFINFTLFYLDDFKLPKNKYIRTIQNLTPIWLLLVVVIFFYLNILTFNDGPLFLDGEKTTNNTVNIGGSVEMNRDAAKS